MKIMKAKELIENNSLTNIEVTEGQTVVFTEIAMTAINMAREEGAKWQAEQSPWISVKDRLPEENTCVFFILEWRGIHKEYFAGSYKEGKWETEQRTYAPYSFWGIVTHWMPIPKI